MDGFQKELTKLRARRPPQAVGESTSFWSLDAPTFDEEGRILTGGMWKGQRDWWELPNRVKVMIGGYGAGKTISASKRAIALALHNSPAPVAVVSPTYSMAQDTVVVTIAELLDGKRTMHPGLTWTYKVNSSRFLIDFYGRKGTIIIYSGEKPDRLKGPNLGAAIIDEPFIQDQEVFNQMMARVRHPDSKLLEVCMTGTPEAQGAWGRDLIEGDLGKNYDLGFVRLSTRQNVALDPSYVQSLLAAYDEKTAEAYIEGFFVTLDDGQVYYSFDRDRNIQELGVPHDIDFLGVGMDFNVSPMTAAVFWMRGDHMHIVKTYEQVNSDTESMCRTLMDDWGEWGLLNIYPDPAGKQRSTSAAAGRSDFDIIKRFGFKIHAPSKHTPIKDRYNAFNGKLQARNGATTLTIEPKGSNPMFGAQHLITAIENLTHANKNKRGPNGGDRFTHISDAAGYAVDFLFPVGRAGFQVKPLLGY